jgi:hypothetical protein
MATGDVLALGLSIPLLMAVSLLYDALVLRWSERKKLGAGADRPSRANPVASTSRELDDDRGREADLDGDSARPHPDASAWPARRLSWRSERDRSSEPSAARAYQTRENEKQRNRCGR